MLQIKIINKTVLKALLFNKFLSFLYLIPFILGFVLYYFNARLSTCILMNLTHLPCPFCGLGRSFINITHLKFFEAIQYNLTIIIIAPLLIILIVVRFFPKKRKIKIYIFLLNKIKLLNYFLLFLILFIFIYGLIRIFDVFFHFFNFKNIIPEITVLKFLFNRFY